VSALTIEQQCRLADVSRPGFYRYLEAKAPAEADLALRDRMQQMVAATRQRRGYRPLTHALQREGWCVNHKRVLRLMSLCENLGRPVTFEPVMSPNVG
jgi:putative transposase